MNKQATPQNIFIFSAELSELTVKQNQKRTSELERILTVHNIPHAKVIGSYKGALETSFRVNTKHLHPLFLNSVIFGRFEQESVLSINGESRTGELVFSNATRVYLGDLKSTSISNAVITLEAFTIYGGKAWYFKS